MTLQKVKVFHKPNSANPERALSQSINDFFVDLEKKKVIQ